MGNGNASTKVSAKGLGNPRNEVILKSVGLNQNPKYPYKQGNYLQYF